MDKIEQLYNLYLSKNIITSKTSLEKFRAANQEQQNKLYELGKNKNLFQTTDFNKFQTAWSGSMSEEPVKKKVPSSSVGQNQGTMASSASQQQVEGILSDLQFDKETYTPQPTGPEIARSNFVETSPKAPVRQAPSQFDPAKFVAPEQPLVPDSQPVNLDKTQTTRGFNTYYNTLDKAVNAGLVKDEKEFKQKFPDMTDLSFEEGKTQVDFIDKYDSLSDEIKQKIEPAIIRENGVITGINPNLISKENIQFLQETAMDDDISGKSSEEQAQLVLKNIVPQQKIDYLIEEKKLYSLQESIVNSKKEIDRLVNSGFKEEANLLVDKYNSELQQYKSLAKNLNEKSVIINSLDIAKDNFGMWAPVSTAASAVERFGSSVIMAIPSMAATGVNLILNLPGMPGEVSEMGSDIEKSLMQIGMDMNKTWKGVIPTDSDDTIGNFIGDVSGQIAFVVGSAALGGTPAALAAGYTMSMSEMYEEATRNGISHDDAMYLSKIYGGVSAPLEMIGAGGLIKKATGNALRNQIIKTVIKEGAEGFTKEIAEQAVKLSFKPVIKETLKEGAEEGLQEGAQYLLSKGLAEAYNEYIKEDTDAEFKKTRMLREEGEAGFAGITKAFWGELGENIALGAVGGMVGGVGLNVMQGNVYTGSNYKAIENMLLDPKQMAKISDQLTAYRKNGTIKTDEELQLTKERIGVVQEAAAHVDRATKAMPESFGIEQQKRTFALVTEKLSAEKQIEGMMPILAETKKAQIEEIDNQIRDIASGKITEADLIAQKKTTVDATEIVASEEQAAPQAGVDVIDLAIDENPTPTDDIAYIERRRQGKDNKIENITYNSGVFEGSFLDNYEFIAEGSESRVYRSKDGTHVIKISEPYNSKDENLFNARITNNLLREIIGNSELEVVGYYEHNGVKNPIYKQSFVEGKILSEKEVADYLKTIKGVIEIDSKFYYKYDGKLYAISDFSDNVIQDKSGNIVPIDLDVYEVENKEINAKYDAEVTALTPQTTEEVADVEQQELDAQKINKEAGVDIYVARQDVDANGIKYNLSQINENGNTNTFLIEDADGNEIGKAQLSADGNYLENIRIEEKHRRKGLASKVYDFIELRKGIELEPSPNKQSKEAKALWDNRNLKKEPEKVADVETVVSTLKDAKEPGARIITKAKEILFKGTQSKTKDGKKFSVHNIKQGRFAALDIKLAMDYKGDKPLKQFSIPAGTTIDVVKLAPEDSKKGITTAREIETAAIDASDAQVVKLLTYDSRGGVSEQYIIKDKSILDSSKDVTDSQLKSKLASLKGRIPTQIKRVFDKVKNIKDITYAEQQDIVDQIMSDQADMAQVSESIMQELVELEGKGKISQKQSNAIVSRMSKLDKLNEGQVARFIDYASKILNDANYKFKVDAVAAKLKKAKLNTPRRLGMNRAGGIVKRLFTMDMSLVPKEVFDKYAELVELMASSSSIIEINKDIDEIAKTAQEVLSVVEVQNGKLETLAQVYQDNKSDKLTYSQNLDKMLVDGIVNINDKEILSKYKSLIDKKPAKKKTEAEIEEEKKELIKGILSERKLETRVFATRAETDLAIQTKKLATKENIDLLSIAQLKTLSKVISNINNGLVDRNTFMLRNRLNANNSIQPVYEATLKAKIGVVANYFHLLKKFGNEKMSSTTSAIRSAIGYNIDAEFGDYKSKDLWENLLERLAIGENLNINKVDTIKAKADKILDKIYKSFYRKENRLVESKAKMFLYKLGLEFKSNPDSDQVKSPEAYLEKTISDGDLDKRTLDMLSDILNDKNLFVDGVLDLDKLYSSFNKYEKEFIALAGKINQEASEYAMFDAGIIQDRPITLLNDYVHHIVIKEDRASEREEATKIAEKINRSMTPTTRAEHLTDREDVVTPLNFDLYNSLISGAKKTYLDYYMTEPIMTSRLVLEGLEAKMRKDGTYKENKDNLQALRNKVEEGISNLLFNNVTSNTLIESISENIATEAYRYMLASGNKLFNELLANFSFVAIYKPADYIDGVAALNKIDMEKFASILINSKSIVTNKLLPKNVLYASRLTEISSSKSGVASKKIKSELSDYSKLVYNQTFKRIKNVAGAINDFTIATSDKIMSIPLWYGSFLSEFNKVSGQNLDVEKFIANDLEYIQKYEKDIELARRYADEVSAEATSIKGAFAGTLAGKNLDREKAGIVKRVYYAYNNFMAGFMQGETDAALKGAKAAVGNGRMSKTDGTRLATAIMARSITYNTLAATTAGGLLYAIYKSLYDLEDDEYEKELSSETMIDATKKAAISMISGKLGNVGKLPINYAAEYLNEKYFYDGLEEDYKNITYLPKPDRKEWETPSVSDWIPAFAAKYGPILTTGNQIYRLYDEEIKLSEKDTDGMKYSKLMELEAKKANIPYKRGMLAISILGQLGYIPAAKNVTKIARREAYRDK